MAQAKITKMTPKNCKELDIEIKAALADIAEQYGLVVEISGGSYSPAGYSPKLKLNVVTEDGIPADFKNLAPLYSMTEDDYGKEIRLNNGHMAKITGINTRRPKYPISVVDVVTGRSYKLPDSMVLMQLGRPQPADPFANNPLLADMVR